MQVQSVWRKLGGAGMEHVGVHGGLSSAQQREASVAVSIPGTLLNFGVIFNLVTAHKCMRRCGRTSSQP